MTRQSSRGVRLEIVQDILIKVLRPAEAGRIKEPLCPDPDVHIYLPKLYKVRTVAERMKAVSSTIIISANGKDEFTMSVEEPETAIECTWKNCGHPTIAGEEGRKRLWLSSQSSSEC